MRGKRYLFSLLALSVGAALLWGVRTGLAGTAKANGQKEQEEMLATLLPGGAPFVQEELPADETVQRVYRGQTGCVVETVVQGYVGAITTWVGIDQAGTVTGVAVRDLSETWGLGRRALTNEDFLAQLVGTARTLEVGQDVDALTGATVTSKAIVRAVNTARSHVTGVDGETQATEWG